MKNIKDQVYKALCSVTDNVSDAYPHSWAEDATIQYTEEQNSVYEHSSHGELVGEDKSLVRYRIDIWHRDSTSAAATILVFIPFSNFPACMFITLQICLGKCAVSSLPDIDLKAASFAISSLERLGIITIDRDSFCTDKSVYIPYEKTDYYKEFSSKAIRFYASKRADMHKYLGRLTPLGKNFFEVCVK